MHFTKANGLGNDFMIVEAMHGESWDFNALAPKWCDRHVGVGADGFAVVMPSKIADIRMRIINADGSEAEMCGNASRCFCKYVYEKGFVRKESFSVETLGGIIRPVLTVKDGVVTSVCVDIGEPKFECSEIPVRGEGRCINRKLTALGQEIEFTAMAVGGVPHVVVYVDDVTKVDVAKLGYAIEHSGEFPALANINFTELIDDHTVKVRTWERGCGVTLACGTGSTSTAVASALTGKTGRSVDVQLILGTLHIDWKDDNHMYMTGPAELGFTGDIDV